MKQWLAILAVVGLLALPAMVSADNDDGETKIPREANWTSTPPTPGLIAVPQKRVVTTTQEQASDTPRPAAVRRSRAPVPVNAEDVKYREVNETTKE